MPSPQLDNQLIESLTFSDIWTLLVFVIFLLFTIRFLWKVTDRLFSSLERYGVKKFQIHLSKFKMMIDRSAKSEDADDAHIESENALSFDSSTQANQERFLQKLAGQKKEALEAIFDNYMEMDLPTGKKRRIERILASFCAFLVKNGSYDKALQGYQELVKIEPRKPEYTALLGDIYYALDEKCSALDCYTKANEQAEEKLAWILGRIGQWHLENDSSDLARQYFLKALSLEPHSELILEGLVKALSCKKKGQ